jgi:uncharacterized membrane-anchored protein
MTLPETFLAIIIQTIAKLVENLAWFILIIWGVKTLVKEVPGWLKQYEDIRKKQRAIDNALEGMRRAKN